MVELPNPRSFETLHSWARELFLFLEQDSNVEHEVNPEPILLPHKSSDIETRTGGVDGLLSWDVINGKVAYSYNGAWYPMALTAIALAEQIIKTTFSHTVSVVLAALGITETDTAGVTTAGGKTTVGSFDTTATQYALVGSVLLTNGGGDTTFVVETSDDSFVTSAILVPDTILSGAGSIQLTFSDYLIVQPSTTVRVSATTTSVSSADMTFLVTGNIATIQ